MRTATSWLVALAILSFTSAATAAQHASWSAYMKKNRYKCPGPADTFKSPTTLTLSGKKYRHNGYQLIIDAKGRDADKRVVIGILSAIKDATPATRANVEESIAWFKKQKVEWLVANGDLALEEFDLVEVVDMLGKSGFPVLVTLGNSESVGSWARTYKEKASTYPNLINGVWVRQIIADDVEFWTMPGYHDKRFVHQGAGCRYDEEDIRALRNGIDPEGSAPVALVSHGPPEGEGKDALDWILDKKNVGDSLINQVIDKENISVGLFGHILEAGGAAVAKDMKTAVKEGKKSKTLYVNAGSASGDPWGMNDGGTSYGMAMIVTIDRGQASYRIKRFDSRD